MPVALFIIGRPTLRDALERLVPAWRVDEAERPPRVVIAPADAIAVLRMRYPAARFLAVVADAPAEAAALEAGIDDAVAVAAPDALIAARARRLRQDAAIRRIGDLSIDRIARRAWRAERALALLPREFALLDHLAAHAGRTVTRAELHIAVFGLPFHPGTNRLTVHVSRLRAALDRGFACPMLLTERGCGYRLVATGQGTG